MTMELADHDSAATGLPSWRAALVAWTFGLLLLAAVIALVVHLSEVEEFGQLLRRLRPAWLLAAFSLQSLTYVCAAGVWKLALAREGRRCRLRTLLPMTLAMLFAN